MSRLRLMGQNQWNYTENNSVWKEKGMDCSARVRMKAHVRILRELMPDIVGGQEVNADMQRYLKVYCLEEGLPYTLIWGNMTPLIYRADKLELLDTEYLLYPEHVEGYEGSFNDVMSKACNVGVFRAKEDGKIFIFATTHLWWQNGSDPKAPYYQAGSDQVRKMQVGLAIDLLDKYAERYGYCPTFLAGDFNADYDSEAIQYALTERKFFHAHDVAAEYAQEDNGYNGCGPEGPGVWQHLPFKKAIDHILVRDIPVGVIRRFERYMPDYYLNVSDHAPVFVDVDMHA